MACQEFSISMKLIFCLAAVVSYCVTISLAQWDCISLENAGKYNGSATTYCDNYECNLPCDLYADPTNDMVCSLSEDDLFPTCLSEFGDTSYCDVPVCNEHAGCYDPNTNGTAYRGLARYTETGYRCQRWTGVIFDNWNVLEHPDAGLEDDYCRNPTNLERPWCFHANSDGELQWSYCLIPACKSTLLSEFTRIPNLYNTQVPDAPGNNWKSTTFAEYFLDMEEECASLCEKETEFFCRQFHLAFQSRYCEWLEYGEYHQTSRVAFRYDTYGDTFIRKSTYCDGFEVGVINHPCALPLGIESSWIADADIRASSYLDEDHAPHFARLYGNSSWIPHLNDRNPVIQVTFPERMMVTGLLMQGGGERNDLFISLFKIAFRVEGYNRVMFYQQSLDDDVVQTFEGNAESSCVVQVFFRRPIWTHEIQVWPYVRDGPVALRLEFFGCRDNDCDYSILQGISSPIPDRVNSSSSQDTGHHAGLVTLNPFRRGGTGWIPSSDSVDPNPWWQVSFGFGRNIAGMMSRKCEDGSGGQGWLTLFDLTWALPGTSSLALWQNETIHDLFLDYTGGGSLALVYLETMLYDTRIVQISPTDWGGDYRCVSLELIGCDYSVYSRTLDDKDHEELIVGVSCMGCNMDTLTEWHLHKYASDGSSGIEFTSAREKWIEIEFKMPIVVSGFVTQGGTERNVTFVGAVDNLIDEYFISYQSVADAGMDEPWRRYLDTDGRIMVFYGLRDPFGVTTNNFDRPFVAFRLRITLQHMESLDMGRIRFRVQGSELTDITEVCSGQEILYGGYCLGTINLEEEGACHEAFMSGSYPLNIKSEAIQNFLLENRERLPLTNGLIIGLRSDRNGTFSWWDGTPVLYDNFGLNVMPSGGMEQCALINFFNCFAWELYDCSPSSLSTICQADLNECLAPNHGCAQTCVNDDGGFHCTCDEGYRLEGHSDCEDECLNPFELRNQTWFSIGSGACLNPTVWKGTSEEAKNECDLLHGRLPTYQEVIRLQNVLNAADRLLWVEPFDKSVDATIVGVSPVCPAANASVAANVSALLPNCYEILDFICIRDVSNTRIQDLFDNGVERIDLNEPFGYIEFRGFAPWYYTGLTISITIAGTPGQDIRLDIISVALRTEGNGCKDSLSIQQPSGQNSRVICGNLTGFRLIVPSHRITLEVQLGELEATMEPLGFSLYYKSVDCSREVCVTGCGKSTLVYQDGVLETAPFPSMFSPFGECQVQISAPPDKYIAIEFTDNRINTDGQCSDKLAIDLNWNEPLDGGCLSFPPLLITNTNIVDVILTFGLEPASEGLQANVSFLDKPGCFESSMDRCSSIVYDCGGTSGIIISPDYPLMAMGFMDCRWEITAPESSYVRMHFTGFDVISDCPETGITIFEQDGTVTIGMGLVELARFCRGTPPVGPVESNLNRVTVVLNNGMGMNNENGIRMMLEYEAAFFGSPYIVPDTGKPCPPSTSLNQGHWDDFNGACYQFIQYPELLTWTSAEVHCKTINPNGHLVSIRSREEARFIHYMMTTHWPVNDTDTYIGLGNRNYRGIFRWTDGSPMTYTDWFIPAFTAMADGFRPLNEPDGGIIDGCSQISLTSIRSTALWHDIPCLARTTQQFICKIPTINNNSDIAQTVAVQLEHENPSDIPECPATMIRCGSGECVHSVYTCDGIADCADGTDEMYCDDVPDVACASTSYTCTNGDCIPMSFYCDNVTHCGDQSDEYDCAPYDCNPGEFRCDNGRCVPSDLTCDLVDHCFDSSDEKNCGSKSPNTFTCYNGDNHPLSVQCDGIVDCIGSSSEDELQTCDYRQMDHSCGKGDEFQCINGACALKSSYCVYDISPSFYVTGCRDVSHLRSCENFDCPTYHMKCPYSYCIPLRFRCNDIWDCPNGDDEMGCDRFVCPPGTYSCRDSNICLRPGEVCDGIQHCPGADDEQFCEVSCPSGCNCTGLAFLCGLPATEEDPAFIFSATAKKIAITSAPLIFSPNGTDQVIPVSGDDEEDQVTYTSLWPSDYPFLAELELVDTGIKTIPATAFLNNQDLYYLNLSRNPIETIELDAFANLTKLRVLDIRESSIPSDEAVRAALQQIPYLHTVYADSFAFCCMLGLTKAREMDKTGCFAPIDQFSSCDDLLKDNTLRVFMWILGISALAGNLCTIVLRLFRRKVVSSTRIQSRLITNLAISDLLMGIYMLTIAIADQYYMGDYAIHADTWRESVVCRVAGFLSALSSEVSVFIIMLISIDRILCIVFSQHHHIQLSGKSSMAWLAVVWTSALVLTLVPVFPLGYFGGRFYGRSSVCLGLPLSADRPSGWEYSLGIFLGLNLLCFIVTAICYVTIYVTVHQSAKSIANAKDGGRHVKNGASMQVKLATRMAMIVGTDFICWMPIIIMGFLAASGTVEIPADVYAWTAVFILPLNSSLNPYLYTISTIWQHRKAKQKQKELRESEGTQLSFSTAVAALPERGQAPRVAQEKYTHLTAQCILTPYNAASMTMPLVPLAKYIEDRGQPPSVVDSSLILRDVRKAVSNLKTKSVTNVTVTEDEIAVQLNSRGEIVRAFLVNSDTALLETISATKHERRENLHNDFMTAFMEKIKDLDTVVGTPVMNGHRSAQKTSDTVHLIEEKA